MGLVAFVFVRLFDICLSLCLFFSNDTSKPDAARITKLDRDMVHHES